MTDASYQTAHEPAARLPAIDWMRGIVMILMATDHANLTFNANRPVTDSFYFYDPSQPLVPLEFAFRWISHLCAPTFVFLAGTSLALSVGRKVGRGVAARAIDRDLFVRGLLIVAVDLTLISYLWTPGMFLLGVMYAIGASMMFMIVMRRLPVILTTMLGLGLVVACEAGLGASIMVPWTIADGVRSLLIGGGLIAVPTESYTLIRQVGLPDMAVVAYPVLPWLAEI
ncbi:MAG: DUF1624 domain-containing protein [Planctomycetota bacterium]|jgi:uncharacterized membrane protein